MEERQNLCEEHFTVYVKLAEDPGVYAVDVGSRDSLFTVTNKAAAALNVDGGAINLFHDEVALSDFTLNVTRTTLMEGSEVEAKVDRQYLARKTLGRMGLGWCLDDLRSQVVADDGDSKIASVVRLMIDADDSLASNVSCMTEAAERGLLEVVKAFRANKPNNALTPPLLRAAKGGQLNVMRYLVEEGADVCAADHGGASLHYAVYGGHLLSVQYLVEAGAALDASDARGDVTLHSAVSMGRIDLVQYLVGAGACLEARNANGRTSMHIASYWGNLDVVQYLVNVGANPTVLCNSGKAPLDYANEFGRPEHHRVAVYLEFVLANK